MDKTEARGYSKGYVAGRKRGRAEYAVEKTQRAVDELWNRAFLAALPVCITVEGWKRGDKPISDIPARTKLAAEFADEATNHMRRTP